MDRVQNSEFPSLMNLLVTGDTAQAAQFIPYCLKSALIMGASLPKRIQFYPSK